MGSLRLRFLVTAAVLFGAGPARADDLRSALVSAYQTNPTLAAARENQKATDESVNVAKAPGLPSLSERDAGRTASADLWLRPERPWPRPS